MASFFDSPKTAGGQQSSLFSSKKSASFFDSPDPYDTTKLDTQISNANKRIADAGYVQSDADQRNWFEKATNLPQNQNWIFDTLDLIGRPGNAVKNVIDKTLVKGNQDVGTALYKGFSGQDKVTGADLAQDFGVNNKLGKFALGTALDIGLDPTTYVPGGVIAKGLKTAVKPVGTLAKGAYGLAESVSPALKTLRETKLAPAAEGFKDGLGYMFKPDYKKTETLFGTQDDFLKNLDRETENSRLFMKENAMTRLADTAKLAGGVDKGTDVGRLMEKDLTTYGPRPMREMTSDPNVTKAAEDLVNSNAEIRQYALEKGIEIPELAGYMTHVLTQEERARKAANKTLRVDVGQFGTGNPNKKILGARTLQGSAEDVNQQLGRDFFNTNAFFATGIGQQRLIDYIHAVDFRRKVLSNPNFAMKFEPGMDLGKNVKIDTANYSFLKNSDDALDGLQVADKVGGEYAVTPQVKMLLDRYQKVNADEGTKAFLRAYDTIQGTWKKLALFSPGFHMRNAAGALWNNYLSGMNPAQLVTHTVTASNEVKNAMRGKESQLFKEYRSQGLGSTGLSQVEYGSRTTAPEKAIEKTVTNRSLSGGKKLVTGLKPQNWFDSSRNVGDAVDQVNRFALYKWAREVKKMSPEEAAAKVKETQFDYTNLTPFEQKSRRLIPFYSWSRNNIPFQIKKFIEDPSKFANLNKVRLNAQDAVGLDENNMPGFMKESFAIPVSGSNGKGKMLGLNLPASDLTKLSNPLKLVTDSITPLIKTPIELAANYNLFKGKPIEKFQGEQKKFIGDIGIPAKAAYALEQGTGQIGRGLSQYLQKQDGAAADNTFRTPSFGISSVLKPYDAAANAYYEKLNELKQLQDLMLYIQQEEGAKPRTLAEIKKGGR